MRRRTARILRRTADRLDPKPARWYQVNTGTTSLTFNGKTGTTTVTQMTTTLPSVVGRKQPPRHRRVLADYLSTRDLKKLRP